MFVTNGLRAEVETTLTVLDKMIEWLANAAETANTDKWDEATFVLAAERAFHVAVECATDVGNRLIDALILREPGGYGDILRVLVEERILSAEWFERFAPAIRFRHRLVHDYANLCAADVADVVKQLGPAFSVFAQSVRRYLESP